MVGSFLDVILRRSKSVGYHLVLIVAVKPVGLKTYLRSMAVGLIEGLREDCLRCEIFLPDVRYHFASLLLMIVSFGHRL